MNINLHIERLILEGLPLDGSKGVHVQKSVERELTTLLANGELHDALRSGGNLFRMQTSGIHVSKETSPADLGEQIAGAVYGGLGK